MTVTSEEHQGGCLCGAVRYRLPAAPDWSAHCHCGPARRRVELTVCNTSPGIERGFCGRCGTSLTYVAEERWPGQVSVLAPTLDDPGIAAPTAHVYVELQLPWVKLDDGLPPHEQFQKNLQTACA